MNLEIFREYCLSKKGVTEELPFGPDTLVYKVMGKMFALTGFDFLSINLKNLPEKNQELRAEYASVLPGYHMHKQHWNTVNIGGNIKDALLREWIDESYEIVASSLTKKIQEELKNL
ncbi:MmcQ/YjbR family DNA-binding protein [Emticicia sp.]|uniref:MmcQ/YjbR family DNA-binding protein n=1 Tax=Emticicia sp. TaxID=1930953 RepID=UPI003750BAED